MPPKCKGVVEKPDPAKAPSNLCIIGRYILQPEIFGILDQQERGAGNEIQLTDAMAQMIGKHALPCRQDRLRALSTAATRSAFCMPISRSGCRAPISRRRCAPSSKTSRREVSPREAVAADPCRSCLLLAGCSSSGNTNYSQFYQVAAPERGRQLRQRPHHQGAGGRHSLCQHGLSR